MGQDQKIRGHYGNQVPQYTSDTESWPWRRCGDCGALTLPEQHPDAAAAPHDADCRRGQTQVRTSLPRV